MCDTAYRGRFFIFLFIIILTQTTCNSSLGDDVVNIIMRGEQCSKKEFL